MFCFLIKFSWKNFFNFPVMHNYASFLVSSRKLFKYKSNKLCNVFFTKKHIPNLQIKELLRKSCKLSNKLIKIFFNVDLITEDSLQNIQYNPEILRQWKNLSNVTFQANLFSSGAGHKLIISSNEMAKQAYSFPGISTKGIWLPFNIHLLHKIPIQGINFTIFKRKTLTFNIKHKNLWI